MGLYGFTHMPFILSNVGSSFNWWNNAWGNQQFVTLLLYLDDICIFGPTINDLLDHIELVFDRLKQFNLKIKPKKCQFFNVSVLFLGYILSAEDISANPEKVEKIKTWPVPKNIKEVQFFFWGLASYYRQFIINLLRRHNGFMSWWVQLQTNIRKNLGLRTPLLISKLDQKFLNVWQSIKMHLMH